jgi:Bax protein
MPDFTEIEEVDERKREFFDYLTPVIRAENDHIRTQRERLSGIDDSLHAGRLPGWLDKRFLEDLAQSYDVEPELAPTPEFTAALLNRVDVIPRSLVLVQAAMESGWGGSRFAQSANNLFGQWCFRQGCGVVPRDRPAGMIHEVRRFDTVRDSVASYIRNLNTHASYRGLRAMRADLRRRNRPLSGSLLAEGLHGYSERGAGYVREVQTMIRQNGLENAVTEL